jgi:surface protein
MFIRLLTCACHFLHLEPTIAQASDMSKMFQDNALFNCDISAWDTSRVYNFQSMFAGTSSFNQDLSKWDTGE